MIAVVKPIVIVRREYRDRLDDPPRTDKVEFASRFDAIEYAILLYHAGVVERAECVDHRGHTFYSARRDQFDFTDNPIMQERSNVTVETNLSVVAA